MRLYKYIQKYTHHPMLIEKAPNPIHSSLVLHNVKYEYHLIYINHIPKELHKKQIVNLRKYLITHAQ